MPDPLDFESRWFVVNGLPRLLFDSGRYAELTALIDGDWLRASTQVNGHYGPFLQDVALARDASASVAGNAAIGGSVRWALSASTIASIAAAFPPRVYPALIKWRFLSLVESVTFARRLPDPLKATEALLRMAQLPQLRQRDLEMLLREALAVRWVGGTENDRPKFMAAVAPLLSPNLLLEALDSVADVQSPAIRQPILASLVPQLRSPTKERVLSEALALARNLRSPYDMALGLARLSSFVEDSVLEESIDLLRAGTDGYFVTHQTIVELAPRLPLRLYKRVLSVIESLPHGMQKVRLLITLATQGQAELFKEPGELADFRSRYVVRPRGVLPARMKDQLVERAVAIAAGVDAEERLDSARVWCTLTAVIPRYGGRAVRLASRVEDYQRWSYVAPILIGHVGSRHRRSLINSAFQSIEASPDLSWVVPFTRVAGPYFSTGDHRRALDMAATLLPAPRAVEVMADVAMCAPGLIARTACERVYEMGVAIQDYSEREAAGSELVAVIAASETAEDADEVSIERQFEAMAERLPYRLLDLDRTYFLATRVFPRLSHNVLDRMAQRVCGLDFRDGIHSEYDTACYFLTMLVHRLSLPGRMCTLDYALQLLGAEHKDMHAFALCLIADAASEFSASQRSVAMKEVEDVPDPQRRLAARVALAVGDPIAGFALLCTDGESSPRCSAEAEREGSSADGESAILQRQADIRIPVLRDYVALAVLPYVSDSHRGRLMPYALSSATTKRAWGTNRPEQVAAMRLAGLCRPHELGDVLTALLTHSHLSSEAITAVRHLSLQFCQLPPAEAYEGLRTLVLRAAGGERGTLIRMLGAAAPLLCHVGGPEMVRDTLDAIVHVTSWFK